MTTKYGKEEAKRETPTVLRRGGKASLRCLQANTQNLGNKQEQLEIHLHPQGYGAESGALAGTACMILALSRKSYWGQAGKKGERGRHVLQGAP